MRGSGADVRSASTAAGAASRERISVRVFSLALLLAAVVAGAVLLGTGAATPPAGPVLILSLAMALCVNRFALFPTEHAATAEPAVLLAAVVGFRGDAVILGPLLVALLVGPLDALHWEQRAFVRMAYNAGNRGCSVLAASGAFVLVRASCGLLPVAVLAAVLVLPLVDAALSYVLLRLQGASGRDARRHVVDVDALSVPIATYGAAVGFLATGVGWWATGAALIPAAFTPELVFARGPWRARLARDAALALVVASLLAAIAWVAPVPPIPVLVLLGAVAVLAGWELVADARAPVPPMLAAGIVVALVVAPGTSAYFAGALVAGIGALIAWRGSRADRMWVRVWAVALGMGAALIAAGIADRRGPSLAGQLTAIVVAAVVFAGCAVLLGRERRRTAARTVWAGPVLVAAVAWSFAGETWGPVGRVLAVAAIVSTFAGAAWWGAPPWRGRALARSLATRAPRHHHLVLRLTCAGALAGAVTAAVVSSRDAREAFVFVAAGLGAAATGMVLVGIRQWRFLPRARAWSLVGLSGVALGLLLVYVPTAVRGATWPVALPIAALVVVERSARHPVARAADVARAR